MEILVVDDHKIIVEEMIADIEDLNDNYICHGYHSAKEALESAKESHYDVAILDIEMPDMDGLTLARKLIALSPNINIIFATGYGEYALESYELYASAFLLKPVSQRKLEKALNNLRHPVADLTDDFIADIYSGENSIGKNIEKYRTALGMTRKDLAAYMDVTVQTIHRWEHGERIPDIITAVKLSRILGVSMEMLLSN